MDKTKLSAFIVSLAILFGTTSPTMAAANKKVVTESGDKAVLSGLEQRLFFKTYSEEELDARLSRLEKRVFGDVQQGDFAQRLEKVKVAATPPPSLDAAPTEQPTQTSTAPPPVEDRQSAMERAKIAVMAAKEEEIAKLLADGVEMWRQHRGPQAIERFEQVIRLDPHNAEAHFNMGVVYESANSLVEASTSYHRAAQENPNNKDYHDAVLAVEKKLNARKKTDDKQGELRVLAEDAASAYKRGEYFSALDLYKQLDAKAPNQALVKYNIGTLYFATKNFVDALAYYRLALKLKPNEPRYQNAVQQLSAQLGKVEESQKQSDQQWQEYEAQKKAAQLGGQPQGKPGKPNKHNKDKAPQTMAPPVEAASQPDLMSSIGIIAKSSHDGLCITTIGLASRAAKVGLQQGDIIMAVDGNVVKSPAEMNQVLARKQQGSPVQLMIQRAKQMGQFSL